MALKMDFDRDDGTTVVSGYIRGRPVDAPTAKSRVTYMVDFYASEDLCKAGKPPAKTMSVVFVTVPDKMIKDPATGEVHVTERQRPIPLSFQHENGSDLWAQMYTDMKGRPEFAGAVDA